MTAAVGHPTLRLVRCRIGRLALAPDLEQERDRARGDRRAGGREVDRLEELADAARLLADKEICFLNSHEDHRESDNFTAVIFRDGLTRFAADGIKDPAAHFRDKTIRVRGRIEEHQGRPQIKVEQPGQIEVVEAEDVRAGGIGD